MSQDWSTIYQALCEWIRSSSCLTEEEEQRGEVHSGLELRTIIHPSGNGTTATTTTTTTNDTRTTTAPTPPVTITHRGIFATRPIAVGETLIRLPRRLAIDGSQFPSSYSLLVQGNKEEQRHASPWLRCLAAYYYHALEQQQQQQQHLRNAQQPTSSNTSVASKQPYLDSLPKQYETVSVSWSREEIQTYLAGTTSSTSVGSSSVESSWRTYRDDDDELEQRYKNQIRPYLVYCGILKSNHLGTQEEQQQQQHVSREELDMFLVASQCLSTRSFHLQVPTKASAVETTGITTTAVTNTTTTNSAYTTYSGPYLLPWIDLLNHARSSDPKWNTRLLFQTATTPEDYFWMKAERPIAAGEEICHSYGDDLTSCQCLQTFGFVEQSTMELLASSEGINSVSVIPFSPTPVLLSKQLILESCWQVMESVFPQRLADAMEQAELEDEVWPLTLDKSRNVDFLPDEFVIQRGPAGGGNNGGDTILASDDALVTLCCLPFLPTCAYREAARSLLSKDMLDDYFLGHLVGKSLLLAIERRAAMYTSPIVYAGKEWPNDQALLQELLFSCSSQQQQPQSPLNDCCHDNELDPTKRQRAMYGLTLRLDEKASLETLRKEVLLLLAKLQEGDDDNDGLDVELGEDDDDDDHHDDDSPIKRAKTSIP